MPSPLPVPGRGGWGSLPWRINVNMVHRLFWYWVVTQCFRCDQYELTKGKVKKDSWDKETGPLSNAYQTHWDITSRVMVSFSISLSKCYVCPASCCLPGSRLRVHWHRWEPLLAVSPFLSVVCVGAPADGTLPLRLESREHDDDGVVPGRGLHETTELVSVHPDDWAPGRPLHHLLHLLRQQVLNTQMERKNKEWESIGLGRWCFDVLVWWFVKSATYSVYVRVCTNAHVFFSPRLHFWLTFYWWLMKFFGRWWNACFAASAH